MEGQCYKVLIELLSKLIQLTFGWTDVHLHRFRLRGKDYGIHRDYGPWYSRTRGVLPFLPSGQAKMERGKTHVFAACSAVRRA